MKQTVFVTGTGTDVGKTLASAIICKSIKADYWKPIQSGDLDYTDSMKVENWVNDSSFISYPEAYRLSTPASPHLSAKIDGIEINPSHISRPTTDRSLVIEGAGGLMVPINDDDYYIHDLILPMDRVILVSRHYLGSINHTLLSLDFIKNKGINKIGVMFIGDKNSPTEDIIAAQDMVYIIGRIPLVDKIDPSFIEAQSLRIYKNLVSFLE